MRAFANRENAGVIREVAAATEGPLDAIASHKQASRSEPQNTPVVSRWRLSRYGMQKKQL